MRDPVSEELNKPSSRGGRSRGHGSGGEVNALGIMGVSRVYDLHFLGLYNHIFVFETAYLYITSSLYIITTYLYL